MERFLSVPEDEASITVKSLEVLRYSTVANADLWKDACSLGMRNRINWWLAELSHSEGFESFLNDNRKRVAQISELSLPACNMQVLGQSGSGKSMFMRGLIAIVDGRRTYQRGHTIFKARGEATLKGSLRLSDEQNSPANDISKVLRNVGDSRKEVIMQIAHRHTDLRGDRFPHTLFFSECELLASCPTADFFDFENDTGIEAIEDYKARKKPRTYFSRPR